MTISVSPAPQGTPRRRRVDLGVFGNQTVVGVITFIALIVGMISALIAYLDWQINVTQGASTVSSPSPSVATGPTPSMAASETKPAITSPATVPGTRSPAATASPPHAPAPADRPPAEDLSYRLSSTAVNADTVAVTADASGQPQPGLTYWFIVETNWGDGNIDYFPRRKLTGASQEFEITIPPDAEAKYVRHGRIYGLTSSQSADAEGKLERQSTTRTDDYFDRATGQISSNAIRLPFS
ncbi:hypothetical protein [Actinoplanes sp. NPDC026670]|uniref:hypothetical protein n=1 Tax=Actinoplanes sp. NPDC026670 TaxID=3154700 RepID=UPI0034107977